MTFDDFLVEKKIDAAEFRKHEPDRWQEWSGLFGQVGVASFTAQKLYLINPTRRKYHLKESPTMAKPNPPGKPVVKPKIH